MGRRKKLVPERVIGFTEGIDNSTLTSAFALLQNFPQFKLIRKIPLNAVLTMDLKKNSRILEFS